MAGAGLPFTTSFTHARSAKISRLYSGRRRCSMLASAVSLLVPRRTAFPVRSGPARRFAVEPCPEFQCLKMCLFVFFVFRSVGEAQMLG
jgi:hypothetical protein